MDTFVTAFDFVFGCHHSHLSRVFTIDGRTYRVCCDCGAKFKYSLTSMCIEYRFGSSNAERSTPYEAHEDSPTTQSVLMG